MPELDLYRGTVRPEWVDYNGHLRDAYYMLIFSFATDALIERIGLDAATRSARKRSLFTLEAHINYLHETRLGAQLRIAARPIAHDAKRLHLYLEMFADARSDPVAASEQMLLHVDTGGPRAVAFDPDVAARVQAFAHACAALPPAQYAGRTIALPPARRA
ncbi:thioesterase family protein [Verminephrobacter aporrectodeae]|uniref:Thioesterase n=1 Tax=Verminephrobacter aporrectodeae subsp. tuberculatae TaxID=1110392 RepID=A0ABT3KQU4_9BURK|nr:thioesterase family protein [Verminephrobacter aporrectodeae]MCW5320694.1 thioesterase [Verminephrobacter aporrectodeae subsp. tuberculatae]MCW8166959.1 thioesterase [Verminephrobacter aporrectodeae subsp. tuberculatae]MCW8171114.1 thioesterase [Verminephrobacter aporrectodeae subsp. tuberculatae]MCW8176743.1 thioesterase [Verminephrobacter aporrectodeae subsp. tuberculatae]MCW8204508.1 thioesterase [Verminephrobacter aporrectodeae subsp. tuberculatae]